MKRLSVAIAPVLLLACSHASPEPTPPSDLRARIDQIVRDVLEKTGVPSASIAAVKDREVFYVNAYGDARLDPRTKAKPEMRYSIGSISKQFTAAAVLMLVEEGKLSLDDPVSRYIPGLTRGDEVTIRELLSHTSGYQDYAPQDYMVPEWEKPISGQEILDRWAKKPLDFEPGTKWQYSNTNFVIAGLIVEKVGGAPPFELLRRRVFGPLGMTSVTSTDLKRLPETDPAGYFRRAGGPLHPSPKEGPGWMYAAGDLAMTAEDLAKWDISLMRETVLKPASYRALETEVVLKNGVGTRYGLGISVSSVDGHRALRHGGEVSGYVAENDVLPDDDIAVVVLTNQDASSAAADIADRVRDAILKDRDMDARRDEIARRVLDDLAKGTIDRGLFTANANQYFTEEAVREYSKSLSPLGKPKSFEQTRKGLRGGMTSRRYKVTYADKTIEISVYEAPDGKLEQYLIDRW